MPAPTPPGGLPRLSPEEQLRYGRHLVLPEVGPLGQRRLKAARVLLVGAGGLGSPVALYLAAAGVGTLTIVEADRVEASNLQRQVLHGTAQVGRKKGESARDRLRDLNPHVDVALEDRWFSVENALELVRAHDLVVDGTDSFATRYLVNDACVLAGKPNFYGSVFRFEGQASVFCAPGGPCYRCLYPEPPPPDLVPSCAEGGVLGVVPGLVGVVQASEVLKWLTGAGTPLVGRLLLVDALGPEFRTVKVNRDPLCPACGTRQIRELREDPRYCRPGHPAPETAVPTIEPDELRERLGRGDDLDLVDVREPDEWGGGHLAGARLVPLSQLGEHLGSFAPDREVVLYCSAGGRSERAARQLLERGLTRVRNLSGGIRRWVEEMGPSLEL
ncbi:MAG TPA: molybdopterin-synthase adenylyltransferase MoeB [Anaeromyxobacter sp.]|nr:molybdopterin-synthase adenylyltransferase MoeB [Anaeromyxobacter sp.]